MLLLCKRNLFLCLAILRNFVAQSNGWDGILSIPNAKSRSNLQLHFTMILVVDSHCVIDFLYFWWQLTCLEDERQTTWHICLRSSASLLLAHPYPEASAAWHVCLALPKNKGGHYFSFLCFSFIGLKLQVTVSQFETRRARECILV